MTAIFAWMAGNPLKMLAGGITVFLLVALGTEKVGHARTKNDLAQATLDLTEQQNVYARQARARTQAVSEALVRAGAELETQQQRNNDLSAAAARDRAAAENDRRDADKRVAALENSNEKLREWNNLRIPDGMVSWMLEPVGSDVPGTGDSQGAGADISITASNLLRASTSATDSSRGHEP